MSNRHPSKLNRSLFTETGADSAALNALGTLVHRFPDEGDYLIEVRRDGALVGSRLLAVSDEYHTLQVTYDLATFGDETCDCAGRVSCEADFDCIREDGVAAFHVGSGPGGYTVTVDPVGERRERREFDSDELGRDDAFSVLLLRPGTYTVRNEVDDATGKVTVRYPEGKTGAGERDALEVAVTDDGFEPTAVEIDPGRGLSFTPETPAHVVVELERPHENATEDVMPGDRPRGPTRVDVGSAVPFDPASRNRSEIESEVADLTNATELRAVLLAERRGEDRDTVVDTLRDRIRETSRLRR